MADLTIKAGNEWHISDDDGFVASNQGHVTMRNLPPGKYRVEVYVTIEESAAHYLELRREESGMIVEF